MFEIEVSPRPAAKAIQQKTTFSNLIKNKYKETSTGKIEKARRN